MNPNDYNPFNRNSNQSDNPNGLNSGYPNNPYQSQNQSGQPYSQFPQDRIPPNLQPQNYNQNYSQNSNNSYNPYNQYGQQPASNQPQSANWYPVQNQTSKQDETPSSVDDYLASAQGQDPHITPGQTMGVNSQYAVDYLGLGTQQTGSQAGGTISIGPLTLKKPVFFGIIGVLVVLIVVIFVLSNQKSPIKAMDQVAYYRQMATVIQVSSDSSRLIKDTDLSSISSNMRSIYLTKKAEIKKMSNTGIEDTKIDTEVQKDLRDGKKAEKVKDDASDALKIGRILEKARLNNRYDSAVAQVYVNQLDKMTITLELMIKHHIMAEHAKGSLQETKKFKQQVEKWQSANTSQY